MDKRKIRDIAKFTWGGVFFWLYIPHILLYLKHKDLINSDIKRLKKQITIKLSDFGAFLFLIHNNRYYRTLFYKRIGAVATTFIGWWRPGDRYFSISETTKLGEGFLFAHPYATILNAESIGKNFSCIHCTTLGKKDNGRPIIGDNVSLGAHVIIIGNVRIGNNVTIGAGSVVVKDIPDNCVVAGNPARIIKYIN